MPRRRISRLRLALAGLAALHAAAYSVGDVDPRALRGVWRLTAPHGGLARHPPRGAVLRRVPLKEFTTHPPEKMPDVRAADRAPAELFLRLEDDHTFRQCAALRSSDGVADGDASLERQLRHELSQRERDWVHGIWDFVDGQLILAADRPAATPRSVDDAAGGGTGGGGGGAEDADTIFVGEVAVRAEDSLHDNPARERRGDDPSSEVTKADEESPKRGTVDVHLSVPKGKIKTGRFMYPKTHPSFFEQPIYRPRSTGKFELRQILSAGMLADDPEEGDLTELFRKEDLVGKRFYLSAFPIPKRRKKFDRWDPVTLSHVREEYEPTAAEKKEEGLQQGKNMQVMAIELFANNTFSTLCGLGSSTVLRGKWSIVGRRRDQLRMMVYRFGFGRSVSGSTFSEGASLTQNDEKCYWGEISRADEAGGGDGDGDHARRERGKFEIEGSVMIGCGLEPFPIGRFKMIEIEEAMSGEDDETEDEAEYEEMSVDDVMGNASNLDSMLADDDPDVEDGLDSFDVTGAFE